MPEPGQLKRGADCARGDDANMLKPLVAPWLNEASPCPDPLFSTVDKSGCSVHLSEGRGQNNQQPTPNDNKSEWWSSSAVLVYDLHRGMCCKPSGKVQEGREGLLMGNICDW